MSLTRNILLLPYDDMFLPHQTFLSLEGVSVRTMRSPHAYGSRLHPQSWEELSLAGDHYTKFIIVRDPMERLVSCYKDKMVRKVATLKKISLVGAPPGGRLSNFLYCIHLNSLGGGGWVGLE